MAVVALEGNETITKLPLNNTTSLRVGDKLPTRNLLTLDCEAFLPDSRSITDGLADEREKPRCEATLLDLGMLQRGDSLSMRVHPRIQHYWRITAITPTFSTFEIGAGEGEDLRIIGLQSFDNGMMDTSHARITWNRIAASDDFGSRVELAADCPDYRQLGTP